MYLLNLTLAQFLALFGAVSAIALTLYLLDRSRRKIVVSTLRFWTQASQPASAAHRRRIRQPWSLILQLLTMALLLLAIGQLHFGRRAPSGRDHVLILDVSAWMGARLGDAPVMETARARARRYIRALPARDRIMLVRADAMTTPATGFEPDRNKLDAAIAASQPGATALNLDQAFAFARHMQSQEGRTPGEIAYIGAGRIAARDSALAAREPRNLRVIATPGPDQNRGIRRIGLRRSASDPSVWEVYISAHNYSSSPQTVTIAFDFRSRSGLSTAPPAQPLSLPAGGDAETSLLFRNSSAGILTATLLPHDDFPRDDSADMELPAQQTLQVTVYSEQPDLLRPVLSSNPLVTTVYRSPLEYRPDDAGLVVLDRFIPPVRPIADSLWIEPPAPGSPIPIRETVSGAKIVRWNDSHPLAAGLRTKDFRLDRASVFEAGPTEARIGEVEAGPVIVARAGKPKIVAFGFHPELSAMRYELATPLLFANALRWVSPEIFRSREIVAGAVGMVELKLDDDPPPNFVEVVSENGGGGAPLPYTLRKSALRFFAGAPGTIRVRAGDREYVYSLTLPEAGDEQWRPSAQAARGLPPFTPLRDASTDPWPWLAAAGAAAMITEWLLYGSGRGSGANRQGIGAPRKRLAKISPYGAPSREMDRAAGAPTPDVPPLAPARSRE